MFCHVFCLFSENLEAEKLVFLQEKVKLENEILRIQQNPVGIVLFKLDFIFLHFTASIYEISIYFLTEYSFSLQI